jgi:hypothetical protein
MSLQAYLLEASVRQLRIAVATAEKQTGEEQERSYKYALGMAHGIMHMSATSLKDVFELTDKIIYRGLEPQK